MTSTSSAQVLQEGTPKVPDPGRAPSRLRRSWDKYWYAYAMVAPVVIVLGVLIFYPLVRGVLLSLTNATNRNIGNPRFDRPGTYHNIGLDNYTNILSNQDGQFYKVLLRTLVWTGSCVVLHYLIGMTLAIMLNRELRGRTVYRVLLILPWAVPAFISAFAWRFLFNEQGGLINTALGWVGVAPVSWLGQSNLILLSVIIVNVWLGVPFMMVALLGGLQSIPAEQYEAAEMDGATAWQRFANVTLPGLRSVSTTVILLGTIWTFNMFPIIFLLARNNEYAQILVTYSYNLFYNGQLARSATYGVIILSLLIIFATSYRRVLRKQGEVW
jgi:arabinogalactan oligomer / maltooligosaccharide transport system permease protein